MALIQCPDCKKNVSDKAQSCPNCGYPIYEEVARIASLAEDNTIDDKEWSKYINESEKHIAKNLLEAVRIKDSKKINLFQTLLKKRNQQGEYLILWNESREFSDDANDQYEFLEKNYSLMFDYLDYDLDPNGFRDYYGNEKTDRETLKGRGFVQISNARYDTFLKYYTYSKVYCILNIRDLFKQTNSISKILLGSYCKEESKCLNVIVLKKNLKAYELLVKKSSEFIEKTKNNSNKFGLDSRDLVHIYDENVNRVVVDRVAQISRKANAIASLYKMEMDEREPLSTASHIAVGGALGGIPGALIGAEVGKKQEKEYKYAQSYNERLRREREERLSIAKYGDIPTEIINVERQYWGIRTYAGIIPFYCDDFHEDESNVATAFEAKVHNSLRELLLHKRYVGDARRDEIARKYLSTGIIWPEEDIFWDERYLEQNSVVAAATLIADDKINMINSSDKMVEISSCYKTIKELEEYINIDVYEKAYAARKKIVTVFEKINRKFEDSKAALNTERKVAIDEAIDNLRDVLAFDVDTIDDKALRSVIEKKKIESKTLLEIAEEKKEKKGEEEKEKKYLAAIEVIENDESPLTVLENACKILESIEDYKDSKKRIEDCNWKINKIKIKSKKEKRNRKILKITILLLIVSSVAGIVLYKTVITYNIRLANGIELRNNGDYEGAIDIFNSLVGHKAGISDEINETLYQKALFLAESEKFDEAIDIMSTLNDYSDAKEKMEEIIEQKNEVIYQQALALLGESRYSEAKAIFETIVDYRDSSIQVKNCVEGENQEIYDKAISLIEDEDYISATETFLEILSFKDVSDLIIPTSYNAGVLCLDEGDYENAIRYFDLALDYEDASSRALEAKYQYGLSFYNENKYEEAISIFEGIEDYSDSSKKLLDAKNGYVQNHMNTDDEVAVAYLNELVDNNYSGARDTYNKFYAWKITGVSIACSGEDFGSYGESLLISRAREYRENNDAGATCYFKYDDTAALAFSVEGGCDGEPEYFTVKYITQSGAHRSVTTSQAVYSGWIGVVILDLDSSWSGDVFVEIYDSKGNMLFSHTYPSEWG